MNSQQVTGTAGFVALYALLGVLLAGLLLKGLDVRRRWLRDRLRRRRRNKAPPDRVNDDIDARVADMMGFVACAPAGLCVPPACHMPESKASV